MAVAAVQLVHWCCAMRTVQSGRWMIYCAAWCADHRVNLNRPAAANFNLQTPCLQRPHAGTQLLATAPARPGVQKPYTTLLPPCTRQTSLALPTNALTALPFPETILTAFCKLRAHCCFAGTVSGACAACSTLVASPRPQAVRLFQWQLVLLQPPRSQWPRQMHMLAMFSPGGGFRFVARGPLDGFE
jgi:hypothetical protein